MNEPSIGWLMVVVAMWTVAITTILLALVIVGPDLWRVMREWFAPVRVDNVVSIDERRRQLRSASGWTRDLLMVAALVGLLFATPACASAIHCVTRMVGYTDYDFHGDVIGQREIPIMVCQ